MKQSLRVLAQLDFEAKRQAALIIVEKMWPAQAMRLPRWWAWTCALSAAIAIQRLKQMELIL